MKQRLTLYPSTFLWIKNNRGLMYDSYRGGKLEFTLNSEIGNICNQFLKPENLYTVELPRLSNEAKSWLNDVTQLEIGFVSPVDQIKSISLPPLLNLQCDYERRKNDASFSMGKNILNYFHILNIFVGGKVEKSEYYKQILYPKDSSTLLDIEQIEHFFLDATIEIVSEINVLIGNQVDEKYTRKLVEILEQNRGKVRFYIMPELDNDSLIKILDEKGYKTTLICSSDDIDSVKFDRNRIYNFLIKNEKEYDEFQTIIAKNNVEQYSFTPVFENNLKFFEDNVFLNQEDLLTLNLIKREIFAHMAININHFGTLNILPDGTVYSNVNSHSLGTVDEPFKDLLLKEMDNNYAWRVIRNNKTCSECLFQWLCPSPSNYEAVMQRETICNI